MSEKVIRNADRVVGEYEIRKLEMDYDVLDVNARFMKLYTALVYDAMEAFGLHGRALESGIYPLTHDMKCAGPAFTWVRRSTPACDPYTRQMSIGSIRSMTPGCVLVNDPAGNDNCGQFGEITATAIRAKGVAGYVGDFSTRDSNALIEMKFPTFVRARNPVEGLGRCVVVDYQIPIYMRGIDGRLLINPGDYIFGDNDGVVVIPKDMTIKVLEQAEEWFYSEGKSRAAIAAGEDPIEVYNRYGRF